MLTLWSYDSFVRNDHCYPLKCLTLLYQTCSTCILLADCHLRCVRECPCIAWVSTCPSFSFIFSLLQFRVYTFPRFLGDSEPSVLRHTDSGTVLCSFQEALSVCRNSLTTRGDAGGIIPWVTLSLAGGRGEINFDLWLQFTDIIHVRRVTKLSVHNMLATFGTTEQRYSTY